jgi:hypothetical protein
LAIVKPGLAPRPDGSLLIDKPTRGLGNVVVSILLRGEEQLVLPPGVDLRAPQAIERIMIVDRNFVPHVAIVSAGSSLVVENVDDAGHPLHANLIQNEPFSFALKPGETASVLIPQGERLPVPIRGIIHPSLGYLVIADHPYIAVTDTHGRFSIPNLPPGEWTFRVWHERSGFVKDVTRAGKVEKWILGTVKVTIKPGKNDLGEVRVSPAQFAER